MNLCSVLLLAAGASGAANDLPTAPVLILMTLGVLVAIGGHLYGSRAIVGMGVFLLFLATLAMIVASLAAYNTGGGEGDPRPPENPASPDF